jgi:hypothetical protein
MTDTPHAAETLPPKEHYDKPRLRTTGHGKTEFIMDGIKRLPNDARIFLIVPEQFTYEKRTHAV